MKLKGVFCAIITPFAKGNVDLESFREIIRFLKERVNGILVCGTTGEFPLLSFKERKALLKVALTEESEEFMVLPHIGTTNLKLAKKLALYAKKQGAGIAGAVAPFYYPWSFDSILNYYKELGSILPILIYDVPKYTGISLQPEQVERIAEVVDVVGLKETTTDKKRLKAFSLLKNRLDLLVGSDSLIDFGLKLGYSGCISAISNFVPKLVRKIYLASQKEKWKKASALQAKISKLRSFFKKNDSIRSIKKAMELKGLKPGKVRGPFLKFSKQEEEEFFRNLHKILKKVKIQI